MYVCRDVISRRPPDDVEQTRKHWVKGKRVGGEAFGSDPSSRLVFRLLNQKFEDQFDQCQKLVIIHPFSNSSYQI